MNRNNLSKYARFTCTYIDYRPSDFLELQPCPLFRARLLALEIFGYRTEQLVAHAFCGRLLQASSASYIEYGIQPCRHSSLVVLQIY